MSSSSTRPCTTRPLREVMTRESLSAVARVRTPYSPCSSMFRREYFRWRATITVRISASTASRASSHVEGESIISDTSGGIPSRCRRGTPAPNTCTPRPRSDIRTRDKGHPVGGRRRSSVLHRQVGLQMGVHVTEDENIGLAVLHDLFEGVRATRRGECPQLRGQRRLVVLRAEEAGHVFQPGRTQARELSLGVVHEVHVDAVLAQRGLTG